MVCIVLLLSACSTTTTTYTSLVPETYPAADVQPEVLFQAPKRPFVIIGLLESDGRRRTTHPQLIESMKAKAQKVGADCICIIGLQDRKAEKGIMYNPWLGGYQTVGGGTKPRAFGLAIRYVVGDTKLTKELYGKWHGAGTSTVAGEFTLMTTIVGSEGGITGVVTTSSGFSGTINGYVQGDTVELLAIPSDLQNYCILKFVGKYDGGDRLQGQYSSVMCSASEGGVITLMRRDDAPQRDTAPPFAPEKLDGSSL
jgi:hypothetical protein